MLLVPSVQINKGNPDAIDASELWLKAGSLGMFPYARGFLPIASAIVAKELESRERFGPRRADSLRIEERGISAYKHGTCRHGSHLD